MRRLVVLVSGVLALACGGAPGVSDISATAPPATGPMAEVAAQFGTIDCSPGSQDPDRSWCPVTHAGHGPFAPPATTEIRLGLTLAVQPGQDPRLAVNDHTTLSALYIGAGGAKLLDIKPSNDAEMQDLVGVVMSIAGTLKGVDSAMVLAKPDLIAYLQSQATDLHPLTTDADGGSFLGMTDPAIVEHLDGLPCGSAWVVVEQAADGRFVSVFPDVPATPLPQ